MTNLVLQRDVGRFTLTAGKLYLLRPIGGRTVGAVFHGTGIFSFAPPTRIEQHRLARFEKKPALEAPCSMLSFSSPIPRSRELARSSPFAPSAAPGRRARPGAGRLKFLATRTRKTFDPDLMAALLNGERPICSTPTSTARGRPLMFMLNPHQVEAVSLSGKARRWWRGREMSPSSRGGAGRVIRSSPATAPTRRRSAAT